MRGEHVFPAHFEERGDGGTAEKAKEGDGAARDRLVETNLRLVLSLVSRFSGRGELPDDLFQVGCIGLIKAIDNFNTELDVRFSTYAVPMIIGEVKRYLRDNNAIRVSRSVKDLAYKALGARESLSVAQGSEPSLEQIVEKLTEDGIVCKAEEVAAALEAITAPVSLYDPVCGDGQDALYLMDQLSDDGHIDDEWLESIAIEQAIGRLSPREKSIIDLRYYKGRTQMEIADEIGISQAQVSRLEKSALGKMKAEL